MNPVGSYAVQLVWNDGHDSGIYGWEYLYEACLP
ncbi:gamma-butyrobetaine hydroxylase-like domain-containing protein [Promineifilum sp.]